MSDQSSNDSDKRQTIADVAKHADVTATTAARVLSDDRKVPKRERSKVQDAIEALDYRPEFTSQAAEAPQIFLSYSRSDWQKYTLPLLRRLESEGLLVWVDQYAIRGGENWQDGINRGLDICDLLVLCVTPRALNSRFVKLEYRYFLDEEKPVIPVLCEDTKLLPELRGIQYIPYEEMDRLVTRIKDLLAEQEPSQA